jgi:hypothetical protein
MSDRFDKEAERLVNCVTHTSDGHRFIAAALRKADAEARAEASGVASIAIETNVAWEVRKEREACARIADYVGGKGPGWATAFEVAAQIRGRGRET